MTDEGNRIWAAPLLASRYINLNDEPLTHAIEADIETGSIVRVLCGRPALGVCDSSTWRDEVPTCRTCQRARETIMRKRTNQETRQ